MHVVWWHILFTIPIFTFLSLVWLTWRQRHKRIALFLLGFCATSLSWSISTFIALISPTLFTKIVWVQIGHAGTSYVVTMWLMVVLEYLGWTRFTKPRFIILFSIIPTIGIILALTYPYHHLYWYDFTINQYNAIEFKRGWFLLLRNSYFYSLILLISGLTLNRLFQTTLGFRTQAIILAITPLFPVIANILYVARLTDGIDITTFGFGISGILLAIGTLGYDILTLIPIARNSVMQKIPVGVITIDEQMRILDINKTAADIIGKSEKDLHGQVIFKFFSEPAKQLLYEMDKLSLAEEYHEEIDYNNIVYDIRITPLFDPNEVRIGRVIVVSDITSHKQTELALAEREKSVREFQQYLALLHLIRAELASYETLDEIYRRAVEIALAQLGFDRIGLFIIEPETNRVLGTYGTDTSGKIRDEHDYQSRLADHHWIKRVLASSDHVSLWTEADLIDYDQPTGKGWNAMAALWDNNQAIGFIAVDNLITHYPPRPYETQLLSVYGTILGHKITRKRAEIQQQTLINELEAFAHTVAHDLKNPLSIISGFASLALENDANSLPFDTQKFAEITYQTSQKMFVIIDELMTLAEIRHRREIPLGELNTASIIREVQQRLKSMIEETEAQITIPETWEKAIGYSPWIEQVWINYFSNALKYGGTPPIISVGSEKIDDYWVKFWIKDEGAGIPDEKMPSLFSTFTQLSENRATGHGLGLSIVKRIVEKLGGSVGVDSQPNQGSTFYFTLPASEDDAETRTG